MDEDASPISGQSSLPKYFYVSESSEQAAPKEEIVKEEVPKPVEAVKSVPEAVANAGPSRPKPKEVFESPLLKALKSDQKHGRLSSYRRMFDCFAGIIRNACSRKRRRFHSVQGIIISEFGPNLDWISTTKPRSFCRS